MIFEISVHLGVVISGFSGAMLLVILHIYCKELQIWKIKSDSALKHAPFFGILRLQRLKVNLEIN